MSDQEQPAQTISITPVAALSILLLFIGTILLSVAACFLWCFWAGVFVFGICTVLAGVGASFLDKG